MTIVKKFPTANSYTNSWTTPANIYADDGAYAVTAGARNVDYDIIGSGFGFNIPAGSIINSVTVSMQYKLSTTSSAATLSMWSAYGGTLRGTAWSSTAEPTTDTIVSTSVTGTWTVDELNSSSLQVVARVRRTSNTACNYSIDYLAVEVDYTTVTVHNVSSAITTSVSCSSSATAVKQAMTSNISSSSIITSINRTTFGSSAITINSNIFANAISVISAHSYIYEGSGVFAKAFVERFTAASVETTSLEIATATLDSPQVISISGSIITAITTLASAILNIRAPPVSVVTASAEWASGQTTKFVSFHISTNSIAGAKAIVETPISVNITTTLTATATGEVSNSASALGTTNSNISASPVVIKHVSIVEQTHLTAGGYATIDIHASGLGITTISNNANPINEKTIAAFIETISEALATSGQQFASIHLETHILSSANASVTTPARFQQIISFNVILHNNSISRSIKKKSANFVSTKHGVNKNSRKRS